MRELLCGKVVAQMAGVNYASELCGGAREELMWDLKIEGRKKEKNWLFRN